MVFKKQIINFSQTILLIFYSINSFSQSGVEADSMLIKASELIYSQPALTERIAIMISENDNDPKKKIEALFILSKIDYQNANYKSALEHLYSAQHLIKNVDDKDFWNIRLDFNLAEIYRDLQIFDLADKHFRQANQLFQNINKPNQILTEIHNYENAVDRSKNSDYRGSNILLKKNLNASHNMRYLSFLRLGKNYIQTNQSDSAFINFSKVPAGSEILYTNSLVGLAQSSLLKNDWNSAEQYLKNALNLNATLHTQREIYNILSQKYLNEKNIDLHEIYKLKYDSVDNKISANLDQARNLVIKHVELENYDVQNTFWSKSVFILICLIIISAIPLIYYYFKTRSDYKKYLQIVNEVNIEPIPKIEIEIEKEKQSVIPEKSEQLLLKKLHKFEQSENYLNPKISLTMLAKQFDTNTKYLSEVVNKNKDKNFNSYINELRINYIVHKLKNEPKYKNYKVISLAEECGYASHSTFIAAFRSVKGISPASFINFLKKEKNP